MAQAFLGLSSEIVETTRIEFLNLPPIWVLVLVVLPAIGIGTHVKIPYFNWHTTFQRVLLLLAEISHHLV